MIDWISLCFRCIISAFTLDNLDPDMTLRILDQTGMHWCQFGCLFWKFFSGSSGCLGTAGALIYGLRAFKQGKTRQSQLLMRTRIFAQGFTVVAIIVGVAAAALKPRQWNEGSEFKSDRTFSSRLMWSSTTDWFHFFLKRASWLSSVEAFYIGQCRESVEPCWRGVLIHPPYIVASIIFIFPLRFSCNIL